MSEAWVGQILAFWFSRAPETWWTADPAFDLDLRDHYLRLWEELRENVPEHFLGDADTALAAILLFDQFPRNMFRRHADQFSTDPLALAVARGAVERGYDDGMAAERRCFLYMPFEHSETIQDQRRSLLLFTALGDSRMLDYARKHHDVIARFGRFPHRNAMLGRKPNALEAAAGEVVPW